MNRRTRRLIRPDLETGSSVFGLSVGIGVHVGINGRRASDFAVDAPRAGGEDVDERIGRESGPIIRQLRMCTRTLVTATLLMW